MTIRALVLLASLGVGCVGGGLCRAQDSERPAAVVPLSDEPLRLESLGLTMLVPEGAVVEKSRFGDEAAAAILAPDNAWRISVQSKRSTNQALTPGEVADTIVRQLLGSYGVLDKDQKQVLETRARVLSRQAVSLQAGPAERVYVLLPGENREPPVVRGITLLSPRAGEFVILELFCPEASFPDARSTYEAVLATASFGDAGDTNAQVDRGIAVEAGDLSLSRLAASDYARILAPSASDARRTARWERLYRPDPSDPAKDTELGYRQVRAWVGSRGEIDPRLEPARWGPEERREGYLVGIDLRLIDSGRIVDSSATFFMSADRREEAWLVRMSVRDGKREPRSWSEAGARSGPSMTVSTSGFGEEKVSVPAVPDRGYITQVEKLLLPRLLIQADASGALGFYAYDTSGGAVSFRRDSLTRPGPGAPVWIVVSTLSESAGPQTGRYSPAGELIRLELPDGSVWEPVELDALFAMWEKKGLPVK